MKRLTKKVLAVALTTGFAFGAFAEEGIKFSGFIRSGFEGNFDSKTVETTAYNNGKYYGYAGSRLRLNLDIDQGQYGANFRYQADKFGVKNDGSYAATFFDGGNIKYAMGFAKYLDDQIIVGVGKLKDKYTGAEGYESYNLAETSGSNDVYGVSAVFNPAKGLYLSAQFSTLNADKEKYVAGDTLPTGKNVGDLKEIKLNEKLLAFSAKYTDDVFIVAGGYSLSGQGFGYFKYKDIENLNFEVEALYKSKDLSGVNDKNGDKTFSLKLDENVSYKIDELEAGVLVYETLIKDANVYEFYPYVSYKLTDVVSFAFEAGITTYEEDNKDTTYNFTPSAVFNVGKANLRVFFHYDKDAKSSMGTTMKVSF